MSIGGVNSSAVMSTAMVQRMESSEATQGGRDVVPDGDSDDGAVQTPAPVVNAQGQTIGANVNVTA